MEKEGQVSLWIGNIKSDEELIKYIELSYTEDGDCLPSQFLKDFNIDRDEFDEDFVERIFDDENINSISEMIEGCSYDYIIITEYEKIILSKSLNGINSAILLYNFQYNEEVKSIESENYKFQYIGSVKYI